MATKKSFRATHNNSEGKNAWLTLTSCFIPCSDTDLGDSTQLRGLWSGISRSITPNHMHMTSVNMDLKLSPNSSKRSLRSKRFIGTKNKAGPCEAGENLGVRQKFSPVGGQL